MPAAQRLAELESSLAQVKLDLAESIPLLAPLLDIPLLPERAPSLAPEEKVRPASRGQSNMCLMTPFGRKAAVGSGDVYRYGFPRTDGGVEADDIDDLRMTASVFT